MSAGERRPLSDTQQNNPILLNKPYMAIISPNVREVGVVVAQDDSKSIEVFSEALTTSNKLASAASGKQKSADQLHILLNSQLPEDQVIKLRSYCLDQDIPVYKQHLMEAGKQLTQPTPAAPAKPESWHPSARIIAGLGVGALVLSSGISYWSYHHNSDHQPAAQPQPTASSHPHTKASPSLPPPTAPAPAHTPKPTVAPPPPKPSVTPTESPKPSSPAADSFTVATFNVLGASHTDNRTGKHHGELPNSSIRAKQATAFIRAHDVDVLGTQELQRPQRKQLKHNLHKTYDIYPSKPEYQHHFSENSIMWNKKRFELIKAGHTKLHYFAGKIAFMPWVKLKDTETKQRFFVLNSHDPADTKQFPRQAKWRAKNAAIHKHDTTRFAKSGLPVILTGDYNSGRSVTKKDTYYLGNDKARLAYWKLTNTGLVTEVADAQPASEKSRDDAKGIDHIFVSSDSVAVEAVRTLRHKNMTDHPVKLATVSIKPQS